MINIETIGTDADKEIVLATLKNSNGHHIQITNFGGMVYKWMCPDDQGNRADILLGCRNIYDFTQPHPYFGTIIGRYANRIANGKFTLNGIDYQLNTNHGKHHLHGGDVGFDKKIWDYDIIQDDHSCTLQLTTSSTHLEEGYPGNLLIKICYTLNEDNELIIDYHSTTDQPTIINLTNHCYFNLSGCQGTNILDHEVLIHADTYTEIDNSSIPTGRIVPVNGTVLDLRHFTKIGDCISSHDPVFKFSKGFDHNFVMRKKVEKSPEAIVRHPASRRMLEVFTDRPGIQFYTGNWLNGVDGKEGKYPDYAGFCLETQYFPDSPNHPNFPSAILLPKENFNTRSIYKVSIY